MRLSEKAIREFKQIYQEKNGVLLTDEQADELGWKLLELASLTLKNK